MEMSQTEVGPEGQRSQEVGESKWARGNQAETVSSRHDRAREPLFSAHHSHDKQTALSLGTH